MLCWCLPSLAQRLWIHLEQCPFSRFRNFSCLLALMSKFEVEPTGGFVGLIKVWWPRCQPPFACPNQVAFHFINTSPALTSPMKRCGDNEERIRAKILEALLTRWGNKDAINGSVQGTEDGYHITSWSGKGKTACLSKNRRRLPVTTDSQAHCSSTHHHTNASQGRITICDGNDFVSYPSRYQIIIYIARTLIWESRAQVTIYKCILRCKKIKFKVVFLIISMRQFAVRKHFKYCQFGSVSMQFCQ